MKLRLRCWPDGCGDTKETTGHQAGLRLASTWDHASMGHVSRRGFARRACCCCLLLLLLVAAAAPGAAVARGYQNALQSTRAYCHCQAEATLSQAGKKQEVWCTSLSGEAWPVQSVRRNFGQQNAAVESHITHVWLYHNMLPKYNLTIFSHAWDL